MKYLLLIIVVCSLGCGGRSENTLVPNNMTPEQIQAEIDANQSIEAPPTAGGGV